MSSHAVAGTLLVWKFDRLARSVTTFERVARGLTGCGIEFAILSESVDTTTPMGKFTLHLTGALAQLESDTISYRVRAANRHLASTGLAATGGRRCFGYSRDGSLNEGEAALLRDAARRYLDRATLTAVVKGWHADGVRTRIWRRVGTIGPRSAAAGGAHRRHAPSS